MKKIVVLLLLSLLLLGGCNETYSVDDQSANIKLEIETIREDDGVKAKSIDYPVIGGISNSEALNMINNSIYNYVETQINEFDNALAATISTGGTTTELPAGGAEGGTTSSDGDTFSAPAYLSMRFQVTYNKNNVLNVVETCEKVLGPNQEFRGRASFVFDIVSNESLTLGDIFDFDNGFATYVNHEIENDIAADGNLVTYEGSEGFDGISKDANFYVDGERLYIFFDALEIGPGKNVLPTFEFDISKLEQYMLKDFTGRL